MEIAPINTLHTIICFNIEFCYIIRILGTVCTLIYTKNLLIKKMSLEVFTKELLYIFILLCRCSDTVLNKGAGQAQ